MRKVMYKYGFLFFFVVSLVAQDLTPEEINLLNLNKKYSEIPNYGWPISSYGRHYFDNDDDNDVRYKLSPLNNSHAKYGFIEPIKYFNPSVGISQIVGVDKKFYQTDGNVLFVGTMGTAKKLKEGMISLYFFELKDDKIVKDQLIPVKSRVRDIIYHKENNYLVMYLETNNALAIFKKINSSASLSLYIFELRIGFPTSINLSNSLVFTNLFFNCRWFCNFLFGPNSSICDYQKIWWIKTCCDWGLNRYATIYFYWTRTCIRCFYRCFYR